MFWYVYYCIHGNVFSLLWIYLFYFDWWCRLSILEKVFWKKKRSSCHLIDQSFVTLDQINFSHNLREKKISTMNTSFFKYKRTEILKNTLLKKIIYQKTTFYFSEFHIYPGISDKWRAPNVAVSIMEPPFIVAVLIFF